MKDLGKWQFISMVSQGVAMLLGIVGTFVVIRILSVGEWGLVQLAVSIGGALGIYQHLGLVSASTREISSAKNEEDIFNIFVTSAVIRYCVTLPISFGLFFFSGKIAVGLYNNPELVFPLKIYAVALIFQGVQGILNSVISGTKRFKHLFIYQVAISAVNILIFVPFVYYLKVPGYFYAFLLFNIVSTLSLSVIAFKPLKGKISMPNKVDFKRLFKEIFSISIAIYLVKIIYTNWEKLGNNVLGIYNPPEVIAIFAFAMLYAKKIMSISDSVTTVNIPVFSERYVSNIGDFKESFTRNFNKLFSLIVFVGAFATYLSPVLIRLLVGGDKYDSAIPLVTPMVFAFVIYSLVNIINSSVFIPAKEAKNMVFSYLSLIFGTVVSFFFVRVFFDAITAFSWAMVFGSAICLYYMHILVRKKHGFNVLNIDHVVILVQALFIGLISNVDNIWVQLGGFLPFAFLLGWAILISGFVTKGDMISIRKKVTALLSKGK